MRSRTIAAALAAALCGGCVASGTIRGSLTHMEPDPATVIMHYRSERFGEGGTISTTLPDGESFTGRYVQMSSEKTAQGIGTWGQWGVGSTDWGNWDEGMEPWIGGPDVMTSARAWSSKVVATLLGDRGGRIRCLFRLADPDEGMDKGGVGGCEVSGGGEITAEF